MVRIFEIHNSSISGTHLHHVCQGSTWKSTLPRVRAAIQRRLDFGLAIRPLFFDYGGTTDLLPLDKIISKEQLLAEVWPMNDMELDACPS